MKINVKNIFAILGVIAILVSLGIVDEIISNLLLLGGLLLALLLHIGKTPVIVVEEKEEVKAPTPEQPKEENFKEAFNDQLKIEDEKRKEAEKLRLKEEFETKLKEIDQDASTTQEVKAEPTEPQVVEKVESIPTPPLVLPPKVITCKFCGKEFKNTTTRARHIGFKHAEEITKALGGD